MAAIDALAAPLSDGGVRVHHGLDLEAYAECLANFAHWPDRKAEVLRRLSMSEERWDAAAAAFAAELADEAVRGDHLVAQRVHAVYAAMLARLAQDEPHISVLAPVRLRKPVAQTPLDQLEHTMDMGEGTRPAPALKFSPAPKLVLPGAQTLEANQKPFVPSATPFVVPEEELEAYAALTSELAAWPARRAQVLASHGLADEGAWARTEQLWAQRLSSDARLRMHWEGLHKSLLSFIERERARGIDRCP